MDNKATGPRHVQHESVRKNGCIVAPIPPQSPVMTCRALPPLLLVLAMALPAWAGGGKPKHSLSFHAEGQATDGEKRVFSHQVLGEQRFFRITPEITQLDFKAFYPFQADDGTSFGATFFLDDRAAIRLGQLSTSDQSRYLLGVVDGQPVDYMKIDKPVTDGVITLWRGLKQAHLEFLEKKLKIPAVRVATDLPASALRKER